MDKLIGKNFSDMTGILSASLCVVHCLMTPLLLVFLSAFGIEYFNYLFLFISFWAAFETTKHSNHTKIIVVIWGFFGLLLVSVIFESDFELLHYLNYPSSFGLIVGHILNIKYCKKCQK